MQGGINITLLDTRLSLIDDQGSGFLRAESYAIRVTEQQGSADRDQYNISGNLYNLSNLPLDLDSVTEGKEDDECKDREVNSDEESTGSCLLIVSVVAIIGVIALIGYACSGGKSTSNQFPSRSQPWPKGATAGSVVAPVINRLWACSQAPVLVPVNCPQGETGVSGDVSSVHWSLHGDPGDGAKISYANGQFQVTGNAIMEVTYANSEGGPELAIRVVRYLAYLDWEGRQASLTGITNVNPNAGPVIAKHPPNVPWGQLKSSVQAAFSRCTSFHTAPLPPECPTESNSQVEGTDVQWWLVGDPLINASEKFDDSSGIIHVTGSFEMGATYSMFLLGQQRGSQSGNYDAELTVDGTKLDVLQIIAR